VNLKDIQRKFKLGLAYFVYSILAIIILTTIIYVVWLFAHKSWAWALGSFLIIDVPLIAWFAYKSIKWKRKFDERKETLNRQESLKNDLDFHIGRALEIIDKSAIWYRDENSANLELVTSLRTMGYDAEYQPRLRNGAIADIRVGDTLIEGKLSPNKAEIDRLLGQLTEYVKVSNKIHIIIYGTLSKYALYRILDEIRKYQIKIVLTALPRPHRDRHP
jgi:hypothetical protein